MLGEVFGKSLAQDAAGEGPSCGDHMHVARAYIRLESCQRCLLG